MTQPQTVVKSLLIYVMCMWKEIMQGDPKHNEWQMARSMLSFFWDLRFEYKPGIEDTTNPYSAHLGNNTRRQSSPTFLWLIFTPFAFYTRIVCKCLTI